jgi:hypothetical protein
MKPESTFRSRPEGPAPLLAALLVLGFAGCSGGTGASTATGPLSKEDMASIKKAAAASKTGASRNKEFMRAFHAKVMENAGAPIPKRPAGKGQLPKTR